MYWSNAAEAQENWSHCTLEMSCNHSKHYWMPLGLRTSACEQDIAIRSKCCIAQVRLQKSALFHLDQAISCLSLLHVRGLPEGPSGQNRLHALNTMVDLTGTEQVRLDL